MRGRPCERMERDLVLLDLVTAPLNTYVSIHLVDCLFDNLPEIANLCYLQLIVKILMHIIEKDKAWLMVAFFTSWSGCKKSSLLSKVHIHEEIYPCPIGLAEIT